jgi:hypothetical protein
VRSLCIVAPVALVLRGQQIQTALLLLIGIAVVTASFALTLSILDHGVTATVLEVVRYVDP